FRRRIRGVARQCRVRIGIPRGDLQILVLRVEQREVELRAAVKQLDLRADLERLRSLAVISETGLLYRCGGRDETAGLGTLRVRDVVHARAGQILNLDRRIDGRFIDLTRQIGRQPGSGGRAADAAVEGRALLFERGAQAGGQAPVVVEAVGALGVRRIGGGLL